MNTLLFQEESNMKRSLFVYVAALLSSLFVAGISVASTTGNEFQALHTLLTGWASGFLGKSIAIAAFLLGAGFAAAKQNLVPAIFGLVVAIVFLVGPGIIDNMLTAFI